MVVTQVFNPFRNPEKKDFKFLDPLKIKPTTFLPFSESSITTSISNLMDQPQYYIG